jgi:hypothetical protein
LYVTDLEGGLKLVSSLNICEHKSMNKQIHQNLIFIS